MSRIAAISIALSIATMIIAISVLSGFKLELKERISGFNSHMRISNLESNQSVESNPILNNYDFYAEIKAIPEVKNVQECAYKGGIIKTDSEMQGVMLKGVGADYDFSFFKQYLVDGTVFETSDTVASNYVIISESLAKLLNLETGDSFEIYFAQEPVRVRRFTVSGLYNTYYEEMDKIIVLCDIRHIRRLNRWSDEQVSGMEIMLHNLNDIDKAYQKVDDIVSYRTFDDGSMMRVSTLQNEFPNIFNWLAILDMNVLIILIIMLVVAGFNMISSLLIMLLEKISMIGILKSLGMLDSNIRKIFVYRSSIIVLRGLMYGNILGLSLCVIQQYFNVIKLDAENYFFTTVPISANWLEIITLNIASFLLITLAQVIPTMVITKISPDKTMRKE